MGTIDVYANQVLATSGVAQFAASGYTLLDAAIAGTSYQFDFDVAGTATTVLTLPAVTLTAAGIYTIYVVGPRDRAPGHRRTGLLTRACAIFGCIAPQR